MFCLIENSFDRIINKSSVDNKPFPFQGKGGDEFSLKVEEFEPHSIIPRNQFYSVFKIIPLHNEPRSPNDPGFALTNSFSYWLPDLTNILNGFNRFSMEIF